MGGFTINVLECKSVSKWYGDAAVLKSVDFDLAQNEIHAIVGENGAGKSTLVKIISGLVPVDVGTIKFEGSYRTFSNIREIQNSGVALIHQEPRLFPDLSVLENVCVDYQVRDGKSKRFNWKKAEGGDQGATGAAWLFIQRPFAGEGAIGSRSADGGYGFRTSQEVEVAYSR